MATNNSTIYKRADNSYIIYKDGLPVHIPNEGEWADTWAEINQYITDHNITPEVEPSTNPAPETLEATKELKLQELASVFVNAEATGRVMSSLGYEIDATDRANRDVNGLIVELEAEKNPEITKIFRDANNEYHEVTLDNLYTMRLEIIAKGNELYARKWCTEELINSAEDKEALWNMNIVEAFEAPLE